MSASFSSTIHKENGLYRKVANLNLLSRVIETKFVSKIRLSQPNGLLFHSNETSEPELSEVHSHSSNGANQSQMATKMRKLS